MVGLNRPIGCVVTIFFLVLYGEWSNAVTVEATVSMRVLESASTSRILNESGSPLWEDIGTDQLGDNSNYFVIVTTPGEPIQVVY